MSIQESIVNVVGTKSLIEKSEESKTDLIRFGQINFINVLPLTLPLLSSQAQTESDVSVKIDYVLGTPAALNQGFEAGNLDVSAMSSFYFLQNGNLSLVPDMAIASLGDVGSVLFFANRPLKELKNQKIAITSASATSVNLLKVLFAEEFAFVPEFVVRDEPVLDDEFAGALVIGDKALAFDLSWQKDNGVRVDLGAWWFKSFALPMVFGVWAARKDFVQSNRNVFQKLCLNLRSNFDRGLNEDFDKVVAEASNRTGLSKTRLSTYYRDELNFDLTADHLQGLELYRQLCLKHGLL